MHPLDQKLIDLLSQYDKRPLNRRELAERMKLRGAERKQLTGRLQQLVRTGQVEELRRGGYRLAPAQQNCEGVFTQAEAGYGFLRRDEEQLEDLFIPARFVNAAMDGDRVLVRCRTSSRDGRPYGEVLRIVERAHRTIIGHLRQNRQGAVVLPLDPKLGGPIFVRGGEPAENGQVVEVQMERYAAAGVAASGRVSEVLGAADDPQVDIDTVIRQRGLPFRYSADALREAEKMAQPVSAEEIARRTDLRELPLVTIDGETAKDFDDAVALKKEAEGRYRLWVCIADVSHYVKEGSLLDREALERGTSVYFPGYCLPMLPEVLSNGICSLNPEEERLVMTAELLFNGQGEQLDASFYPAVMRSRARLTYTQVAACLNAPDQAGLPADLTAQLVQMGALAQALSGMRRERGSLELEIPEVEVLLDEAGRPVDLVKAERNQAHRLIEEFMLAANEAVASFLEGRNWAFLYRIHEPPTVDKLQEFQQLAAECGLGLVLGRELQKNLQNLLDEIAERPEARLLNQQLLRSLQQARYSPENKKHFGLAADCYCHFTSPIRRYPDLTIHRVLKKALHDKLKKPASIDEKLLALGKECSDKERRAMAAERELVELRRCQVMEKRLGEQFTGTISSVAEFGFFVELDDYFVEGLVHVRSLQKDYYHFDSRTHRLIGERRRQVFHAGMRVQIRVEAVELGRRRLDFTLVEAG